MMLVATDEAYPSFPPGFWRRIEVCPSKNVVVAGVEDDAHRFRLRLAHDGETITGAEAHTDRFPYTTCPGAGAFLVEQVIGMRLDAIAQRDPRLHCTHLFELALLAAAHAGDPSAKRFDLQVADRLAGRMRARLLENGALALEWLLEGTCIQAPNEWRGRDLRELSRWKRDLPSDVAARASMLRRAVQIAGVRTAPMVQRATDRGVSRLGACYTYQSSRVGDALQSSTERVDFSGASEGPLQRFCEDEMPSMDRDAT